MGPISPDKQAWPFKAGVVWKQWLEVEVLILEARGIPEVPACQQKPTEEKCRGRGHSIMEKRDTRGRERHGVGGTLVFKLGWWLYY